MLRCRRSSEKRTEVSMKTGSWCSRSEKAAIAAMKNAWRSTPRADARENRIILNS